MTQTSRDNSQILNFRSPTRATRGETTSSNLRVRMVSPRFATKRERHADIVILGAGLAGTSLAHHLEQMGFRGTIALLDNRHDFNREQRWCTWSDVPASMMATVSHSWNRWQVRNETRSAHCESHEYSYQEIYAPHFFKTLHQNWRGGRIELHTSQKIESVRAHNDETVVETADTRWHAGRVFDSRFHSELDGVATSPLTSSRSTSSQSKIPDRAKTPHIYLAQTFVGRVIEFDRPVFDASCATLMDFRVPQLLQDGVSFAYVLPYSSRRALVETTTFSPQPTLPKIHNAMLNAYIVANFGGAHQTISHESGFVPMTVAPITTPTTSSTRSSENAHPRWTRIGVAGGAARASSGYAFGRIQQTTLQIARSIVNDSFEQPTGTPFKYRMLDEIFLEAMSVSPQFASECFVRLFERVPVASLVRFLDDRSSLLDDARLIAALPKMPFLAATARRASAHFPLR